MRKSNHLKLDNHIDPDIFDIFIDQKIYQKYAQKYLDKSQIDEIDINKIPGYVPPDKRNYFRSKNKKSKVTPIHRKKKAA